jgi:hypothetical protein
MKSRVASIYLPMTREISNETLLAHDIKVLLKNQASWSAGASAKGAATGRILRGSDVLFHPAQRNNQIRNLAPSQVPNILGLPESQWGFRGSEIWPTSQGLQYRSLVTASASTPQIP